MNDNLSSWGIEDAFQSLQNFPPSGNQEISMLAGNDVLELMWQNKQLIMHNHIPPEGKQFVPQHENQTSWFQENQTANQLVPLDDNFCSGIPAAQSIGKDQHHHTNDIRNNMAGTMANFGLTQDVMTTTAAADNNNTHQKFNTYYQMLPPNPQVGERECSSNSNFVPQDLVKQTNGVRRKFPTNNIVASTYDTNSTVASSNIRSYKSNCLRFEEYGSQSEEEDDQSFTVGKRPRRSASARRSRAVEVHNMSERRRRDRINERMEALQELIPRCNKADKASSILDEAIEYLKSLELQLQIHKEMMLDMAIKLSNLQVQKMWMGNEMAPMIFGDTKHFPACQPTASDASTCLPHDDLTQRVIDSAVERMIEDMRAEMAEDRATTQTHLAEMRVCIQQLMASNIYASRN